MKNSKDSPSLGANRRERGTNGAHRSVIGAITKKLWGKRDGWQDGGESRNIKPNKRKGW